MADQDDQDAAVVARLRRIEGQCRGLINMLADGRECAEILSQVAAVKSAVDQVGLQLLKGHVRECFLMAAEERNEQELEHLFKALERAWW